MARKVKYEAVVIGSSAGGLKALRTLFQGLSNSFSLPIIIVQHLSPDSENYLVQILNEQSKIKVKEADEKESPLPGNAYIAPPNYHLMLEMDRTFTLTVEPRVNFARPSIDVLFETAAEAFKEKLIGVILTGANNDGSEGMVKIKEFGGLTIVQDPETAEVDSMPKATLAKIKADHVLPIERIASLLSTFHENNPL